METSSDQIPVPARDPQPAPRSNGSSAPSCRTNATRQVVDQIVGELAIPNASVHKGGIREATRLLGEQRSPRLLVVDISGVDLPLSAVNELAEVCEPGVTVIALGDRNDVGLFRDLINNGVSDYLVKPIAPALMQKSLLNVVESATQGRQNDRRGRLVAVTGARGGVGATMLATGIAWTIANRRRRRVALVDLDLQFGTVALALDLEPSPGLREALEHPGRIDALFVDRAMVRHSDTLFVLSGEELLGDPVTADTSSLDILLKELRNKFHYVVVDVPRQVSPATAACRAERDQSGAGYRPVARGYARHAATAGDAADHQRGLPGDHRRQPRRRVPRGRDRAQGIRGGGRASRRLRDPVRCQVRGRGHQCGAASGRGPRPGGGSDPAGHRAGRRQSRGPGQVAPTAAVAHVAAMSMFGRRSVALPQPALDAATLPTLAPYDAIPSQPDPGPTPVAPSPAAGPRTVSVSDRRLEAMKSTHARIQAALYDRIDATAATKLPRDELNRQILELITEVVAEQRLSLHGREQELLGATIVDNMVGLGPLEPLLRDETITDIMINGCDQVYVERRGKLELSDIRFRDNQHVMNVAQRIVTRIGRRVDETSQSATRGWRTGAGSTSSRRPWRSTVARSRSASSRRKASRWTSWRARATSATASPACSRSRPACRAQHRDLRRHGLGQNDHAQCACRS